MLFFQRQTVLFIFSVLFLWLSFGFHMFSSLSMERFVDGEFPSERHVFSRLVHNLEAGTEDRGGFLLYHRHVDELYKSFDREDYQAFKKSLGTEDGQIAAVYLSHYGLQDNLVMPLWHGLEWVKNTILEHAREGSRWHERLNNWDYYYYNLISQTLVALINALVFALFVLWASKTFSVRHGWLVLAGVLVTQPALAFYGRSLWWMEWSWFLPMMIVLGVLMRQPQSAPGWRLTILSGAIVGAAVCMKGLMGYEFFSTVMAATMVPIAFYACLYHWGWKPWFRTSFIVGVFCLLGAALTFILHWQALQNYGIDPMDVFQKSFEGRAHGGETVDVDASNEISRAVEASVFVVIIDYLIAPKKIAIPQILFMAPFLWWLWGVVRTMRSKKEEICALSKAFMAAIGISFLGAVSMLVILKGHAYVHGYDIVIWAMPLNLFLLVFYAWRLLGSHYKA